MFARYRTAEKREGGFTLIELLVVMIIIGVLAAIAIPIFMDQKEKARESSAKADVKAFATQVETALVDGSPASEVTPTQSGAGTDISFTVGSETYTVRTSPGNVMGTNSKIDTGGTYCVAITTSDSTTWSVSQGQLEKAPCPA